MDGARGICRRYYWWLCLLCLAVFVSSADAATRRYPKMPTAQQVGSSGVAVEKTSTTFSVEMEGVDYIPADNSYSSKGTKLPVKSKYPFVTQRTWNMAKAGMRGGVAGIAGSLAIGVALDSIGGFIDENSQPMKKDKIPATDSNAFWCPSSASTYCDGSQALRMKFKTPGDYYIAYKSQNSSLAWCRYELESITSHQVRIHMFYGSTCTSTNNALLYRHGSCVSPYRYDEQMRQCVKDGVAVPLTDADYALMDQFVNAQNSAWLQGLLKDVCAASPNPAGCFADMKDQGSSLSGPSQVSGPSKTTTSTYTDVNGVSQQTTTTQTTTYNITYGSNYYDYRKTVTTTKAGTDGSSETSTETETPEVTQEEKPTEEDQEEEQAAAIPCSGSNCDGPAYQDQYQPTEETKEDHIDSYVDRVSGIPIIQAVGNLFEVNAGGSCPVWTFNHQLEVLGFYTTLDFVFDYLCQPWFTQYGPWIRAVIYLVAVYAAIRVALL